jgi:hypothetical protein
MGSGGPKGARDSNYRHGRYTAEAIASRRCLTEMIRSRRTRLPLGLVQGQFSPSIDVREQSAHCDSALSCLLVQQIITPTDKRFDWGGA